MEIWLSVIIFILGLCVGSFVNMLIYRVAINYKLESRKFKVKSKKRSFCDGCGRQLRWYENIPVISWIVQKGKTRCCGEKLPILYPIVEVMMGILFLIFNFQFSIFNQFFNFQLLIQFIFGLIIIVFLVFSGVFDLKYMILPDFSTVILVALVVVSLFVETPSGAFLQDKILSAILSFGFLGFLYLITKKRGMGFGDVKLAIFMGLFLGYPRIIVAFYIAFVIGALVSLVLIILKKANRKTPIPFGPFLILGTFVAWLLSNQILDMPVFQFIR